jgi:hypothetical protein
MVQVILGVVLSLASTFAWAYLAAITVGGAIAGEMPHRPWQLAAVGVVVLIGSPLLSTAVAALTVPTPGNPLIWLAGIATALGWLVLLAAFATGVPSPAPVDAATADPRAATPPGSGAG